MPKLTGMVSTDIRAGDAFVFDSRVFHKGTPARIDIEKKLVYDHESLQAELPEEQTKYVLYSQFGNSIGIESYFLDRLYRDNNSNEIDRWIEDVNGIDKYADKHQFFKYFDSLLDGSFDKKFNLRSR